jgi:hypothetical protein
VFGVHAIKHDFRLRAPAIATSAMFPLATEFNRLGWLLPGCQWNTSIALKFVHWREAYLIRIR